MFSRFFLLWATASAVLAASCAAADPASPDPDNSAIQQSRQFDTDFRTEKVTPQTDAGAIPAAAGDIEDDSFGSQQILKRVEKIPMFDAFAGESAFYTNNVALTRKGMRGDAFLVTTAGLTAAKKFRNGFELDFNAKGSLFRYNKFDAFDLDTLDIGAGISYRLAKLWDASVFVDYTFTDLFNGRTSDQFFDTHDFTVGIQKTFNISRAQSAIAGLATDFNYSSPASTQLNDYGLNLGYHADLTRWFGASLFYHGGYQGYTTGNRRDINQSLTLSLEYKVQTWLSVVGSSYCTFNRSNEHVYNYNALATGAGLSGNIRF